MTMPQYEVGHHAPPPKKKQKIEEVGEKGSIDPKSSDQIEKLEGGESREEEMVKLEERGSEEEEDEGDSEGEWVN